MCEIFHRQMLKKHLKCKLCLRDLKNPRILRCMHVFCELCLQDHFSQVDVIKKADGMYFQCPICSEETRQSSEFETVQDLVGSLHVCESVSKLLTSTSSSSPNDKEQFDAPDCSYCQGDGLRIKAIAFCTVCVEYYCEKCCESHRKFKITRSHKVLKDNDLPRDISFFRKSLSLRLCRFHSENENEYKCLDHGEMFCSICLVSAHKTCNNILLDEAKQGRNALIRDLRSTMNTLKDSVNDILIEKLTDFEKAENETNKRAENIAEIMEDLNIVSSFLNTEILEQIRKLEQNDAKLINNCIAETTSFVEKINIEAEVGRLVLKSNLEKHSLVLESNIKQDIYKIEEFLHLLSQTANDSVDAETFMNSRITELKKAVLNKLLEKLDRFSQHQPQSADFRELIHDSNVQDKQSVKTTNAQSQINDNPSVTATNEDQKPRVKKLLFDCSTRKVAEYDIAIPTLSEKLAYHSGSVILSDGNMVFIDRNNMLVKFVSSEFSVKCFERFTSEPVDITNVNNEIILATSKEIYMYTLDKENSRFQLLACHKICNTLLSISTIDNKIAILYPGNNSKGGFIEIRDKTSKIISQRSYFQSKFGEPFKLNKPGILRVHDTTKYIVCQEKSAHCFNTTGVMQWFFTYFQVKKFCYIAFDAERNMYVCDIGANTIHQVTGCSPIRSRIIISNIEKPASVLYNIRLNALVIGRMNNNKVHVYEFI